MEAEIGNGRPRILVVEDSPDQRNLIVAALGARYQVETAESFEQALGRLEGEPPELLLLDLRLPDGDGFQLFSELRTRPGYEDVPVLFLTGSDDVRDKVLAFSLGAQDYLVKPVDPRELCARTEARLRASRRAAVLSCGPLRMDLGTMRAALREGDHDQPLDLTPHEFRILQQLVTDRGQALSREQLLHTVSPDVQVGIRTLDTHVSNLRRKLGPHGGCIESVRGVGYRWAGERSC